MKTLIAVYETHEKALNAVNKLKANGINSDKISILGKAELINNHIHVKTNDTIEKTEVSLGVLAGATLGVLTGVGVFAIPGLGALYGAGALVGGIAGADLGVVGSGLVAVLTYLGIDKKNAKKYEDHLNEAKFLVFYNGNENDLTKAKETLHTDKLHLELDVE